MFPTIDDSELGEEKKDKRGEFHMKKMGIKKTDLSRDDILKSNRSLSDMGANEIASIAD